METVNKQFSRIHQFNTKDDLFKLILLIFRIISYKYLFIWISITSHFEKINTNEHEVHALARHQKKQLSIEMCKIDVKIGLHEFMNTLLPNGE